MPTPCSHCVDQRAHPSFVLLLEAADAVHWDHSPQPLRFLLAQQAPWRMTLVIGPFTQPQRAARFQTVLQRVFPDAASTTPADRRSGAITLARKWFEIEGSQEANNELHVYATEENPATQGREKEEEAAHSLQLVREAVHVLAS